MTATKVIIMNGGNRIIDVFNSIRIYYNGWYISLVVYHYDLDFFGGLIGGNPIYWRKPSSAILENLLPSLTALIFKASITSFER